MRSTTFDGNRDGVQHVCELCGAEVVCGECDPHRPDHSASTVARRIMDEIQENPTRGLLLIRLMAHPDDTNDALAEWVSVMGLRINRRPITRQGINYHFRKMKVRCPELQRVLSKRKGCHATEC